MTNFYIDSALYSLMPLQKLVMNYLIYGQRSNNSGCFDMPPGQMATDLSISLDEATAAIQELVKLGHLTKCSISNYILVIRFFSYKPVFDYKEAVTLQSQASLLPINKEMYWQLYHLLGQQISLTKSFAVKNKRELSKVTADPEATGRTGRGLRIEKDWRPTRDDIDFATKNGISEPTIATIAANFRDYWLQKSGAAARKSDWHATWRTWIRRYIDDNPKQVVNNGSRSNSSSPSPDRIINSIRGLK